MTSLAEVLDPCRSVQATLIESRFSGLTMKNMRRRAPMPNRIHLRDYTVEELRAMPAGKVKNWLAAQVIGNSISRMQKDNGWAMPFVMKWFDNELLPVWWAGSQYDQQYLKFSTDWSAAGRLLEWLMKESGEAGVMSDRDRPDSFIAWYLGGPGNDYYRREHAATQQDAIATAALVFERERMEG
jgi:hypothetical protein